MHTDGYACEMSASHLPFSLNESVSIERMHRVYVISFYHCMAIGCAYAAATTIFNLKTFCFPFLRLCRFMPLSTYTQSIIQRETLWFGCFTGMCGKHTHAV